MPNWTYNNLTISGDSDDMKEFYEIAIKSNVNGDLSFRFSNVFQMPEKIKNTIYEINELLLKEINYKQ